MSRGLILRPAAEEDVRQGYLWYEERQTGLGRRLMEALDAALLAIEKRPVACQEVEGDVRRALMRRFPYGVFYVVEPQRIVVLAVLHTARDPQAWKARAGTDR